MQMAYALSAVVVVFCLYAGDDPQEHPRLDPPGAPGRRRPADQHPAGRTSSRATTRELSKVVAGRARPVLGRDPGDAAPTRVLLHYSVDGGKFYADQEFAPGNNYYDPWQATLRNVQQSMDYYLTGGDAESLQYHLEGPARADGDLGHARLRVPRLHERPPAQGHRGGQRRGDRGDDRHRPRPDQRARRSRRTSTSPRPTQPVADGGRDGRPAAS